MCILNVIGGRQVFVVLKKRNMRVIMMVFFSFSFLCAFSKDVDSLLVDVDSVSFRMESPYVISFECNSVNNAEALLRADNELFLILENKSDIAKITYGVVAFREYKLGVYPPNDPLVTFSQIDDKKLLFKIDYGRMPKEWQKWFLWFISFNSL